MINIPKTSEGGIMTKKSEPVAIVGLSCMFPEAQSLQEYWGNIKNKVDAIKTVPETHWDPAELYDPDKTRPDFSYGKTGGFLPTYDFDPLANGLTPDSVESTDTSQILGLVVAQGAMVDAGYTVDRTFDRDRVSVMVGVCGTLEMTLPLSARLYHPSWRRAIKAAGIDDDITSEIVENLGNSYVGWTEASFPGLLGNVVAGRIANRLDLGGTNCSCDAACASSFSALNLATMELETGRTDMVITGGVDTFNHIFMYMCFSKTPALSPTGDIRPMDASADGTILGEGIGMMVLKRLSDAERDGDKIYAVIKSVGASSDGKGKAIYAPVGNGQKKALRKAWDLAGITPRDIDLIEAHGTGTKAGDAVEFTALREAFGEAEGEPWCAIGSVKSQIGHAKAAAGIAGVIKAAMGLYHKVLPPTIKVENPVESVYGEGSPFYVNVEPRPWKTSKDRPRIAGISSFGFGGSNYHVVLEEYSREKPEMDWNGEVEIVSLSGISEQAIQKKVESFTTQMKWKDFAVEAAKSRREFNVTDKCRLAAVVARDGKASHVVFENLLKMMKAKAGSENWNTPDGAYFGSNETPHGKLGVVFPGQGSQYTGMLSGIAGLSPEFQRVLFHGNETFASISDGEQIVDYVYPKVNFTKEEKQANSLFLTRTENAQPAIGMVSLGLMKLFEQFGLKPESLTGHSYGEIVALTTAGVLSEESCHIMSRMRGVLMSQGEGDRGSMLAVQATEEEVAKIIKDENIDLVIANKNAPKQMVLSGATDEIVRARDVIKSRGIRCKQLSVAAAFHSKFVVPAAEPFRKELDNHTFSKARIPVYANVNAQFYPEKVADVKDVLGTQMSNAVEFVKTIENMYKEGVRTFLEVGPGARLSGLVKNILGSEQHFAIAADSSNGARSNIVDFARALAQLVSLGYDLDLKLWQNGEALLNEMAGKKKPIMTIPICGANYRNPKKIKKPVQRPLRVTANAQTVVSAPSAVASKVGPTAPAAVAPRTVPTTSAAPVNKPAPYTPAAPVAAPAGVPGMTSVAPGPAQLDALRVTQESIFAMQDMQSRVAELHSQFLKGQAAASESLARIVAQQKAMTTGMPVASMPAVPYMAPVAAVPVNTPVTAPAYAAAAPVVPAAPAHTPAQPVASKPAFVPEAAPVAAPVAKPVPVVTVAPAAAAGVSMAKVENTILDVVSEKTGYPAEMLNLDMDMEADLGIDSIKKVEIMSAVQERLPEAPVVQPDQMTGLRTLRQVIDALAVAGASPAAAPAIAVAAPAVGGADMAKVETAILDVVSEKTGYPAEMLNLDMDMEADLGIDSIKKVEIMSAVQERLPEAPVVQPDQMTELRTLRQVIDTLAVAGASVAGASAAGASAAPAAAAVSVVAAGGADMAKVEAAILDVVSEKTGYPAEMLNLDMDMEADLGIDSIKKVEIMSAVQERLPEAPVVQPDQMTELRTLRQVIDTLAVAGASAAPAAAVAPVAAGGADMARVEATILDVVSEKTGYPAEMLNLDMDMEADLGIDSIKKVEIMSEVQERLPEAPVVQPDQMTELRTLRQVIDTLGAASAAAAPVAAAPAAAAVAPSAMAAAVATAGSPSVPMARVEATILDVVSDKTGYPAEMLNLDMDMEADLGIDSIKKVEIMSEVQERLPEAPVVQPDQMTELRTLRQVIDTLGAASAAGVSATAVAGVAPSAMAAAVATAGSPSVPMARVEATILDVVSDKTGYPAEMLNLDMDMEADLGIDSIKKVEIMSEVQERLPEAPVVQPDQMTELRTLRQVIDTIGAASVSGAEPPEASADVPAAAAPSGQAVPKSDEVLLRNIVKAEPSDRQPPATLS